LKTISKGGKVDLDGKKKESFITNKIKKQKQKGQKTRGSLNLPTTLITTYNSHNSFYN